MSKGVFSLVKKQTNNARWPIDCALERIEEFDEVLILAKRKNKESYIRFSSGFNSTFWWIGLLEAMKQQLMDESLTVSED